MAAAARPFLKMVGGKSRLVPELRKHLPDPITGTYYEPFVGGGALFFALRPKRAVLSDINHRLIHTYTAVRDDVDKIIEGLRHAERKHSKKFFLEVRAADIDAESDVSVAIWMIYLNKTCFNGLYRVNSSGKFNVPFGRYTNPKICDEENLRACSAALHGVTLRTASFADVLFRAGLQSGDAVYCDPPYAPLSKSSSFTAYDKNGFGDRDQEDLRDVALYLVNRGVRVLVSNSNAPLIRKLYSTDFVIEELQAARSINSKAGGRGKITELLIR